jgi:methyl-accepting chemotaxis protein
MIIHHEKKSHDQGGASKEAQSFIKRSFVRDSITIRVKLIASFLVPIAFLIILGIASFQVASEGIVSNYKKSTLQTINMTAESLRLGLNSVEAISLQYRNDETISKYVTNFYADDEYGYKTAGKSIEKMLFSKQMSDEFIGNIYILSDVVDSISTSETIQSGLYEGFIQTELGKQLMEKRTKVVWVGKDDYLDEQLGSSTKEYSLRLIRPISGANAMLVIDIRSDTINSMIGGLDFDQSGYLGIITSDGREILSSDINQEKNEDKDKSKVSERNDDNEKNKATDENGLDEKNKAQQAASVIFTGESFYQKAVVSDQKSGSEYVSYRNQTYLFLYSKIGDTGATVCSLIPKTVITGQADRIKKVTVFTVLIAAVIASATAFIISGGIDIAIKGIIRQLKKASGGDLTVNFMTRRKDEFKVLIEEIQNTFFNMKNLIKSVKLLSAEVSNASANSSQTAELFLKSTRNISAALNEIEHGITQQAKDAEECLTQMNRLSQKIVQVSDNTNEILQIADDTKVSIQEGTVVTENLNNQTQSTIMITTSVIKDIEKLGEKSDSINKIINVIDEISNQTNLLSLNASIEAARAGEYGKGFAVVASEIRKLAEQSKGSVNDIKNIIRNIQDDTKKVAGAAKQAEDELKLQGYAVKNTTESYNLINNNVEKLMLGLNYITQNIGNIEEARVSTLSAIENISAVLEEIAASVNTINHTSNEQQISADSLSGEAQLLKQNAEMLVQEVNKFII